ncbi:MAG: sigma-70 family RNA polymerase sigma factor [Gemmatimonadota bacterium]|nr:sigma-70 family RNA polymerase sigma factor [Gemmatimonadota bacterium]
MDAWVSELQRGSSDAAWDAFLERYRRLIFAAIRHYAQDYDDVMDVFARVCESLRADDLRRLRSWTDQTEHRASFSTWLVTVVRNLTIDWFRLRDGRHRVSAMAERMPLLQRSIFERVFVDGRSHLETYELLLAAEFPSLSFKEFLVELRRTYAVVTSGRRGHLFADVTLPPPDELDDDAGEDGELLEEALRSLSPADRVAVEMYVVDQMPAEEVARIVGLPNAKAVYNRVYRALATLRERLERAGLRRRGA